MTVQLAITPDHRWDFATADLISAASAAGFAALGITADHVDATAATAYAAAGIRCHEILALMISDDVPATTAAAKHLAQAAKAIRAEWVLTIFATPLTAKLTKALQRCATVFADARSEEHTSELQSH